MASELLICESSTILDAFFVKQKKKEEEEPIHFDSDEPESEAVGKEERRQFREQDFADFQEAPKDKSPVDSDEDPSDKQEEKSVEQAEAEPKEKVVEEKKSEEGENSSSNEVDDKASQEKMQKEEEECKVNEAPSSSSDSTLLEYLFSFVESKEEINVTLAGYFNKVLNSFSNKRQVEVSRTF